jgi:hypothetical protein
MIKGWVFELQAPRLVIGERMKMGIFRPCVQTIPCSTISHSLEDNTGIRSIHAAGFLDSQDGNSKINQLEQLVMTARDVAADNVKVPITVEFLHNVHAKIIILDNPNIPELKNVLLMMKSFTMGGLKSKGFGSCSLSFLRDLNDEDTKIIEGDLKTRIYEDWCDLFNITAKIERFGYLFRANSEDKYGKSGAYYRSLFEGSKVSAPKILCNAS